MMPLEGVLVDEGWLRSEPLQALFDILCAGEGDARIAGGAVRNALLGTSLDDIDLCTTLLPQEVVERVQKAGHKAIPTGIEHGTITVVVDGSAFEVTTLREDIETDGRHAVVRFGTDWEQDALRRDLTINGLLCDRNGRIFDFVGGYDDLTSRTIRFIGEAQTRIHEDALRILRFFRFFAWYGDGRPDAAGLKACAANKRLLVTLSVERVWMELRKLLAASDPGRALLWMRTAGVLAVLLPETEKWGIDSIPGLIRLEKEQQWEPDSMLRLMAMIRPASENVKRLAARLKLSNAEAERLEEWAGSVAPNPEIEVGEFEKFLYRGSRQGIVDTMRLEVVHLLGREDEVGAMKMLGLIARVGRWEKPEFPVSGKDLIAAGCETGPQMGEKLCELEEQWIESGFSLMKDELLGSI